MAAVIAAVPSVARGLAQPLSQKSSSTCRSVCQSSLTSKFEGLRIAALPCSRADGRNGLQHAADENRGFRGLVSMGVEAGVGIMANKVGMMTWFTEDGIATPCTVLGLHEGNIVTQVKTPATDGYSAVQVAYRRVRDKKLKKPELGHLKKVGAIPMRHLQEFRLTSSDGYEPGQVLNVEEMFKEGDLVDISGRSIGKGFQGGIKVWNFARGPMTHGSKSHRQLGSIGAGTTPGRVYPGKKMPKQLGNTNVKIRKLKIVKVDAELHAIIVKGAVPGKIGNLLRIAPAKIVGKNIPKN